MLGLGLGLNKGGYVKPLPKWLTDAGCTFAINVDRQVRSIANPNSPLQNPLTDVTGKLGKNLFDWTKTTKPTPTTFLNKQCLTSNGGGDASSSIFYYNFNSLTAYTVNCQTYQTVAGNATIRFIYSDASRVDFGSSNTVNEFITLEATSDPNKTLVGASLTNSASAALNYYDINSFQLELGTVATAYEPYGFNNVRMQSVAGTTADGYVQIALPNGKNPYFFKFDGTDTYGIGVNDADTDIIGLGNFGFPCDFKTAPTLTSSFIESKADLSELFSQFGLKLTSTGNLELWLNGVAITVATGLVINTFYHVVIVRESNVLKCEVNGVETYSLANVINILTKPNFRLGAISSNAGGTTHTLFTNIFFGVSAIFQGVNCTMASVKKAYNKLASNYL